MSENTTEKTEQITRDDERGAYVLTVDGTEAGRIDFRDSNGVRDMPHTEVDPQFEGQGYAGKLAQFAFDDAREAGLKVSPTCPYLDRWMSKHPDYEDLRA